VQSRHLLLPREEKTSCRPSYDRNRIRGEDSASGGAHLRRRRRGGVVGADPIRWAGGSDDGWGDGFISESDPNRHIYRRRLPSDGTRSDRTAEGAVPVGLVGDSDPYPPNLRGAVPDSWALRPRGWVVRFTHTHLPRVAMAARTRLFPGRPNDALPNPSHFARCLCSVDWN
jgi:hypothetical protein